MYNSVIKYLDKAIMKYKGHTAISSVNGNFSFEYYGNAAKRIATSITLRLKNINMPIAIYLPKSETILFSMMGILYSGNYYCPIAFGSPEERIKKILHTLENPFVITDSKNYDFIKNIYDERKLLLVTDLLDSEIEEEIIEACVGQIIDTDPIYVLFTSGSTGDPKGVILPHRAVIDYIEWSVEKFKLSEKTVLANQAPFHFDASMPDIYTPLFTGARLQLVPEKYFIFPVKLIEFLNQAEVNTLIWVPSALMIISNKEVFSKICFHHLKTVMFCGEVMPNKHLNYWRRNNPDTLFVNLYGPTEAAYACTYFCINREFNDSEILPIGKACENERVFLLDEEGQQIVNSEKTGEICIQGSCLAKGYFHLQNTSFTYLPVCDRYLEPVYLTGDLGKYNKLGELEYVGRKDSQIKHSGYRIELGEIEANTMGIAEIRNCFAAYDNDKKQIVLFYEADENVDKAFIIKMLASKIPKYMYPERFVRFNQMPFNANGKVDRNRLRNSLEENL